MGRRVFCADDLAALTIWQEARGEPWEGQVAVGEVIRRRALLRFFSDGTVEDTCLRRAQFSGWNGGDPNRVAAFRVDAENPVFLQCHRAWTASDGSNLARGGLLYFNPRIVLPTWAPESVKVAEVGSHEFYIPAFLHHAGSKPTT